MSDVSKVDGQPLRSIYARLPREAQHDLEDMARRLLAEQEAQK